MRFNHLHLVLIAAFAAAVCVGNRVALGSVFWSDGFESYPRESIHGKDSSWTVSTYFGHAAVVSSPVHSGNQSLSVEAGAGMPNWTCLCTWWDDTSTAPHGGMLDFSWWMRPSSGAWGVHWDISALGWKDTTIAHLGNIAVGSPSTLDCETSKGWIETMGFVPSDTWSQVFLQLDLGASPDRYRIRVGDAGTWQDWCTLGSNEQFFRRLAITTTIPSERVYFDDFNGSAVVPEPAAGALLLLAGCFVSLRVKSARVSSAKQEAIK